MESNEGRHGHELVTDVRAALVARGTTLSYWCKSHGINRSWAYEALMGRRNGDKARALRERLARHDF